MFEKLAAKLGLAISLDYSYGAGFFSLIVGWLAAVYSMYFINGGCPRCMPSLSLSLTPPL